MVQLRRSVTVTRIIKEIFGTVPVTFTLDHVRKGIYYKPVIKPPVVKCIRISDKTDTTSLCIYSLLDRLKIKNQKK